MKFDNKLSEPMRAKRLPLCQGLNSPATKKFSRPHHLKLKPHKGLFICSI